MHGVLCRLNELAHVDVVPYGDCRSQASPWRLATSCRFPYTTIRPCSPSVTRPISHEVRSPTPSFRVFQRGGDSGDTRRISNKVLAWIHARRLRALLQAFLPPGRYVKAGCIHDIGVGLPLATLNTRGLCGIPLSAVRAS